MIEEAKNNAVEEARGKKLADGVDCHDGADVPAESFAAAETALGELGHASYLGSGAGVLGVEAPLDVVQSVVREFEHVSGVGELLDTPKNSASKIGDSGIGI